MKASKKKAPSAPQTPVFPDVMHRVRTVTEKPQPSAKAAKRDNIFSKSHDTHEDRGVRQAKTSRNAQTLPHSRS
ncbi:MAG TPA: hypothetical protein VFC44_13155 [Candidatus Saccharimonadales bacterium]|nr:hypothetical protein [Candidatus Saccharimonadales bacterium]